MKRHKHFIKLPALLLALLLVLSLSGCGNSKENTISEKDATIEESSTEISEESTAESVTEENAEVPAEETSEEELIPEDPVNEEQARIYQELSETVQLIGRVYWADDAIWCCYSGTGIEFEYTGCDLSLSVLSDTTAYGAAGNRARIGIYVNGERVVDAMMDETRKEFPIWSSSSPETVTVRVVKLSESAQSSFGVCLPELNENETICPTPKKEHLIEFIGDSITCGYGVDDEDRDHHFSTETEDVTKTYAYKTAQLLSSEYSMVSLSGWGIISGYTNNPSNKSDSQLLPKYYNMLGYSYASFTGITKPQNVYWNFALLQPDAVVINLGTNDESYCKSDSDKRAEYTDAYVDFLKDIRRRNPSATIFCVLGLMGDSMYPCIEDAVSTYQAETGDSNIYAFKLPVQDASLGYAADWHPTEANHAIAAESLAAFMKDTLNW